MDLLKNFFLARVVRISSAWSEFGLCSRPLRSGGRRAGRACFGPSWSAIGRWKRRRLSGRECRTSR